MQGDAITSPRETPALEGTAPTWEEGGYPQIEKDSIWAPSTSSAAAPGTFLTVALLILCIFFPNTPWKKVSPHTRGESAHTAGEDTMSPEVCGHVLPCACCSRWGVGRPPPCGAPGITPVPSNTWHRSTLQPGPQFLGGAIWLQSFTFIAWVVIRKHWTIHHLSGPSQTTWLPGLWALTFIDQTAIFPPAPSLSGDTPWWGDTLVERHLLVGETSWWGDIP